MNIQQFLPCIQSANIRAMLDMESITISDGIGREGDIVLTEVPSDQSSFEAIDNTKTIRVLNPGDRVLAVLGNRESSTHVNGGIPTEGLIIKHNNKIDWIGGKSGILGVLSSETQHPSCFDAEVSSKLKMIGLAQIRGKNINIQNFTIQPSLLKLTIPILFVAATSAEAGKTVLTCKIIQSLTEQGLKVGAIKTTGSGGVLDGLKYKEAGAQVVLDQVDCGLITTYTNPVNFTSSIIKAYRYCEEKEMDVIVAEMGGDIIWANNPCLLRENEIVKNIASLFIINNDALSAIGVLEYLRKLNTAFPVHLLSSPFRNYDGMRKRTQELLNVNLIDVNDLSVIKELALKSVSTKLESLYGEA